MGSCVEGEIWGDLLQRGANFTRHTHIHHARARTHTHVSQVEILEESLQRERETARSSVDQHLRALKNKENEIDALRSTVSKLPSLEDHLALQRQLKIMQVTYPNPYRTPSSLHTHPSQLLNPCWRTALLPNGSLSSCSFTFP